MFSVFSEYISDHSFFDGRKFILISPNFVVGVSVLFEELDEIHIVGDDDELKVFASAEFYQSQQGMGQVLDVFLVQVGGGFIQGKDACR
jgi:hypothetical protein